MLWNGQFGLPSKNNLLSFLFLSFHLQSSNINIEIINVISCFASSVLKHKDDVYIVWQSNAGEKKKEIIDKNEEQTFSFTW